MITPEIAIRSIQHFMYCPHRWGLIEIDDAWAENAFVTKANFLHERVNNPDNMYTLRGKKVFTSVWVYNDEYGIYGVTDCIEMTENKSGIFVDSSEKRYDLCIVEYKPTAPKNYEFNEEDAMQVFAQKLCVDSVFNTDCKAVLYYADSKKRIELPFYKDYEKYEEKLSNILLEIRNRLRTGKIPPIERKQNCNGCSFKDVCIPGIKYPREMKEFIESVMKEEI